MASPKGEDGASSIPFEGEFPKAFMRMKIMAKELYQHRNKGEQGGPYHTEGKREGGGEDPPKTPPYSPFFLDGSFHSPF